MLLLGLNPAACVLVGLGSGCDDADCLIDPNWEDAARRFVAEGGCLIMQGGGKSVETVAGCFGLGWHFAGDCYRRTDFIFNPAWREAEAGWYRGPRGGYNVKTLMLSGVEDEDKVFGVAAGAETYSHVPVMAGKGVDGGMCPVAFATHGSGHVGYVGDVNAEQTTLEIISALANHYVM